jgi:hypothetical protein
VLQAAKELARREQKTAGQVVSELLRRALTGAAPVPAVRDEAPALYGLQPFPRRGGIVTNDLIDQLRGDDAY